MRRLVGLVTLVALAGCGENYNIDEPQTVEDAIALSLSGVPEAVGLSDRQSDTYWSCVEPLIPDIRNNLEAEFVVKLEQALEVMRDDPDGNYPLLGLTLGLAGVEIGSSPEATGCLRETMGMGEW
jgi:hypothetical protein